MLTWDKTWCDLLVGRHLPPISTYIRHRRNIGQCPLCLEVRKCGQCYSKTCVSTHTQIITQGPESKILFASPIELCGKVMHGSSGTTVQKGLSVLQWGGQQQSLNAPEYHVLCSTPSPKSVILKDLPSESGTEAPREPRFLSDLDTSDFQRRG